jgi:hypothetical protein
VATGVVVPLLIVVEVAAVWARAGAAHSRAEALTIAGPANRMRARVRRFADPLEVPWARLRAASGEKYPVINFDPSRRIDRSSMIVSSEWPRLSDKSFQPALAVLFVSLLYRTPKQSAESRIPPEFARLTPRGSP